MNSKTRTYNSTLNIMMGTISKIVSAMLTFIGRKIFLRVFPLEYLGINNLFVDVLSMLTLADLGMATAMAFSFYKPLAEKDEYKLTALIAFYRKIYHIIAIVVAGIGVALVPFIRNLVNLEHDIPNLEVYYLVALFSTVTSYLFVYKASIITADQNEYLVSGCAMWTNILKMVLQIIVMYTTKNYLAYCSVTIVSTLLNNLIISYQANKQYPFIRQKAELDSVEKRNIFQNIKSAFLYKVSTVIASGSTNILISVMVGTASVGLYANYNTTVYTLFQLVFILYHSLAASLGNLVVNENAGKRLMVFKVMMETSFWISGFLIFCLYFMMDDFIILWLGRQYVFDNITKIAILLIFYLTMTMQCITSFREAVGMFQKIKYVMLISAALNIAVGALLGYYFGVAGILLASFISRMATYVWYEPMILFRDFFESKSIIFFRKNIMNLALLAICVVVCQLVIPAHESANWFEWLVKGCICAAAINIVYFVRYHKSEEFKILKGKVMMLLAGIRNRG